MKKYKPEYLGKAIPVDDPAKLTSFVTDKYDSFSKIYDTVKEESENISDIKTVDTSSNDSSELTIKVTAPKESLEKISEEAKKDDSVSVAGDTVTAKKKKKD